MTVEVTVRPTAKSKPGFLKREKRRMAIFGRLDKNDPTAIDDLVSYMLTEMEVEAPEGTDFVDFVMNLSEEDYTALFNKSAVNPTKDA